MAIKLEMLRTFRMVAEHGSLNGAAAQLGRTASAVSMMLAQLEDDIGAPLFETDRKNKLTPLGQLVFEESNRATDAFTHSVNAIRRHAVSTAGTVRIATVPSATITILPGIITAFRQIHPDVRLDISDVDSATVRQRVMTDAADIGILSAATDDPKDGNLVFEDDLGIVCRAGGALHEVVLRTDVLSWELLEHEPLIANPLCRLVGNASVSRLLAECSLEAHNTTALLSFVRAGLGATVLPRSAVQHLSGELVFLMPNDPVTKRQLRKIRPDNRHLGPAAEAFWSSLI